MSAGASNPKPYNNPEHRAGRNCLMRQGTRLGGGSLQKLREDQGM